MKFYPNRNREEIIQEFPDPLIHRRNTGYALDLLLQYKSIYARRLAFQFFHLNCRFRRYTGIYHRNQTESDPLTTKGKGTGLRSFQYTGRSLQANLICLKHNPGAIELMDSTILECTKANIEQRKNRFFVQGDPGSNTDR